MNMDPFPKPFSCREKPDIAYPCTWLYKVIGTDEDALRDAIACTCGEANLLVTKSHSSSSGKYCSLNLEMVVEDDDTRLGHYRNLKNHAAVKIVL